MKWLTQNRRGVYRNRIGKSTSLLIFVGCAIALLFCLSACKNSTTVENLTTSGNQVGRMEGSWAQYYTSLKDLKKHADFAVSGDITKIGAGVRSGDGSVVYSDVTLTVKKVSWNAHPQGAAPSTILFHANGGSYNGKTYVMDEDPMYQIGQHVVLFFTEYSPGKYRVTGGPTGRFVIENKQVKPIVSNGVQLSPGMDENEFMNSMHKIG